MYQAEHAATGVTQAERLNRSPLGSHNQGQKTPLKGMTKRAKEWVQHHALETMRGMYDDELD